MEPGRLRSLLIQAGVFAVLFFILALISTKGQVGRVLVMTVVATGVYAGFRGVAGRR